MNSVTSLETIFFLPLFFFSIGGTWKIAIHLCVPR
jgi:Kef-type K+ transport system membrane component KefB